MKRIGLILSLIWALPAPAAPEGVSQQDLAYLRELMEQTWDCLDSLVNFCEDGLLWKTFDADPLVKNGKQLIAEYRDAAAHRDEEQAYVRSLSP